jgi:hypothetical protein
MQLGDSYAASVGPLFVAVESRFRVIAVAVSLSDHFF